MMLRFVLPAAHLLMGCAARLAATGIRRGNRPRLLLAPLPLAALAALGWGLVRFITIM